MLESTITASSPQSAHNEVLQWITNQKTTLPTPLYVYSQAELTRAVTAYRTLFPQNTRGFYALKANPQVAVVNYLSTLGIGAEVTGLCEWQASAAADVDAANRLVGGVCKSEAFLAEVCRQNPAAIVIESETEWARLQRATAVSPHPTSPIRMLLRINPGVSLGGLNMAGGSQFGLSVEQALAIAHQCHTSPHIQFMGLHFYFGSQRLEADPILQAIDIVETTIQTFQAAAVPIRIVDLGLGCGVPYLARDIPLDMDALRTQLHARWQKPIWADIHIWFEAGRALVASAGTFVARVIDRKQLHDETFVFLDGGLNVHNPGVGLGRFFKRNPQFRFISDSADPTEEQINIVGNLCTTADTLGTNVAAPQLSEGDLVLIPNSGAYCQTTAMWGFNSQPLFHEAMLTSDGEFHPISSQYQFSVTKN